METSVSTPVANSPLLADPTQLLRLGEIERRLNDAMHMPQNRSRTSTINLICCASDDEDAAYVLNTLCPAASATAARNNAVAERHPGRFFILKCSNDHSGEWRARVMALVRAGESSPLLGEIIQLEASGDAFLAAESTVTPLLLDGLPVVLWWRGSDPGHSALFPHLANISDRVLLDSQELGFQPEQFLSFGEAQLRRHIPSSDLTWARLLPWRRLLAQIFDTPAALAQLSRLKQVTWESCGRQPQLNGPALLTAGWFAARLQWTPIKATGDDRLLFSAPGQNEPVEMVFAFPSTANPAGEANLEKRRRSPLLKGLTLLSSDNPAWTIRLDRKGAEMCAEIMQGDNLVAASRTTAPVPSLSDALMAELGESGTDQVFASAMQSAMAILRVLRGTE